MCCRASSGLVTSSSFCFFQIPSEFSQKFVLNLYSQVRISRQNKRRASWEKGVCVDFLKKEINAVNSKYEVVIVIVIPNIYNFFFFLHFKLLMILTRMKGKHSSDLGR